jgi:hypothetical protein
MVVTSGPSTDCTSRKLNLLEADFNTNSRGHTLKDQMKNEYIWQKLRIFNLIFKIDHKNNWFECFFKKECQQNTKIDDDRQVICGSITKKIGR